MIKDSFAGQVRAAYKKLAADGEKITATEVGEVMRIQTRKDKKRINNKLSEFLQMGEIKRIAQGQYVVVEQSKNPLKKTVMCRLLKARRAVTVADLIALAGVTESYAKEWLQMMIKQGKVRREGDKYRQIKEITAEPENEDKAIRLRRIRAAKKKFLEAADELVEAMA